jgi:hypothetical protein
MHDHTKYKLCSAYTAKPWSSRESGRMQLIIIIDKIVIDKAKMKSTDEPALLVPE